MKAHLPAIIEALRRHGALVLCAEPGAGKTTAVPWAIHQAFPEAGPVWVLEPRRLAARMAATRVAETVGEPVGQRVGYRMRHESATSAATQVVYLTEGMLWRVMVQDPSLHGLGCVVFDEFHGRTLVSDVVFAVLAHRRKQGARVPPIVVMSATLDADPIAERLGGAPIIRVPGRQYPVTVRHAERKSTDALPLQVARAVREVLTDHPPGSADAGHLLAFLPGMADIERTARACAPTARAHGVHIAPLHASLDVAAQRAATAQGSQRRLVLATNVAETSVTIDGVTHVIDTGLAKMAQQDPLTGITRLQLAPISQAAAIQRAGRAGRTGPGHAIRLYTSHDFNRRTLYETPEIQRTDLSEAVLWLAALGLSGLDTLPWVDAPAPDAVGHAHELLHRLGALHQGAITPLGRRLLALPVHPRLGRVACAAQAAGITALGLRAVAVLHEGPAGRPRGSAAPQGIDTDDLTSLCAEHRLSHEARRTVKDLHRALGNAPGVAPPQHAQAALHQALLHGFSDRLIRRLPPLGALDGPLPVALGWGGQGVLDAKSAVRDSALMLALEADVPTYAQSQVHVRMACEVTAEDLIDLDDGRMHESTEVVLSAAHGRLEKTEWLRYDDVVLDVTVNKTITADEAQQAWAQWLAAHPQAWAQELGIQAPYEALCARLGWAVTASAENTDVLDAQALVHQAFSTAFAQTTPACRSLKDLKEQPWASLLMAHLPAPWPDRLRREAPDQVTLASGKRLTVHYVSKSRPAVATYLQDFFGSEDGPTLGARRTPVTLHLWGPNRRDLQVTSDLKNFWRTHYPELRRALSRKYPRHAWPEDPTQAAPTLRVARPRRP